ncbi:MAG TPA: xanthine dehydrogenase family protein subunit M [Xanthobacteraceae bacterium]|jgi:CO/xanthine dehydrogenase FAD-binding subunit|nr:xanthine dehydrogenase family protein subunit M [Xanthobacteraceae bacterium]
MNSLRYEAPSSLGDAIALLAGASGTSRILAGGTDIIVQMETDLIEPDLLIDIKKIPELRGIAIENGAFKVGAGVTGMELTDHEAFCKAWPGVVDGVKLIGSMQIKGRATMGGNLCNASPAADSVPALIAARAIARIAGSNGTRDVPVENIPIGPGKTSLDKGEIIVSFLFPSRPAHSGDAYLRMTPRTEMDIAVVGVGVNITLDAGGICTAARVSLGAVAPTPLLVAEAGAALMGSRLDAPALDKLAQAAGAACRPIDDKRGTKEYRVKVAEVLAKRTALLALERARQNT